MKSVLNEINAKLGNYSGTGINHDNEPFVGEFKLSPIFGGKGCQIEFKATGLDKTVFHEERTTIAMDDAEKLALWTLNTNTPFLHKHDFKSVAPVTGALNTFSFFYNDPDNKNAFREEIAIDFWPDGDVSYRYAWGLPGGEYGPRSSVRMKKILMANIKIES